MSSVALVVQHALKALSQNLQVAIFAPPFSASDKFDIYIYIISWFEPMSIPKITFLFNDVHSNHTTGVLLD